MSDASYVIRLPGSTEPEALAPEQVLPFVRGYAAALGERRWLDSQLDPGAPEDTHRMHALQLAETRGWLSYLYLDQPESTRPPRRRTAGQQP